MKENIILIGMPGVGKSTVGVVAAKMLGMNFLDTDIMMSCKTSKTLPQIIDEFGYLGLIALENTIGAELQVFQTVIATGGSMVLSPIAMENLIAQGTVIWLDTDVSKLKSHIGGDITNRGIAAPKNMSLEEIYTERLPFYKKYADISITCGEEIMDTVLKIIDVIKKEI